MVSCKVSRILLVLLLIYVQLSIPTMAIITNKRPSSVSIYQTIMDGGTNTRILMAISAEWTLPSTPEPTIAIIPLHTTIKDPSQITVYDTKSAPNFLDDIEATLFSDCHTATDDPHKQGKLAVVSTPEKLPEVIAGVAPESRSKIKSEELIATFKRLHGDSASLVYIDQNAPKKMPPVMVMFPTADDADLHFPAVAADLSGHMQPPIRAGNIDWRLMYSGRGKTVHYTDKNVPKNIGALLPKSVMGERIRGIPKGNLIDIKLSKKMFLEGVSAFHGFVSGNIDAGAIHTLVTQPDFTLVEPPTFHWPTHADREFVYRFKTDSKKIVADSLKNLPTTVSGLIYLIVERTGGVQRVIFSKGFTEKNIPEGLEQKLKSIKFDPFPPETSLPNTEVKIQLPLETNP